MNIIVLMSILVFVQADIQYKVSINGINHQREILYENVKAHLLAFDYGTNTLYLCDKHKPARLDLNTRQMTHIYGVNSEVTSLTVDQETHVVYIGTTKGIYKYNISTNNTKLIGEDHSIQDIYFKDVLYYIKSQSNVVHKLDDKRSNVFLEMNNRPYYFVIDKENNIFFTNDVGLLKINETKDVLYGKSHRVIDHSLTIDNNDRVYYCAYNGIYEVSKNTSMVKKVVPIDEPTGVAFDDENNIIYSDGENIYRFKPVVDINNTTSNVTNSCSKDYGQNPDDYIKMQVLESIVKKIDDLTQKVERLQTVNNITILNIR